MVELFDKYKLDADYYNFKIVKMGLNRKGEPSETVVGYVNDIAHAVKYLYSIETKEFVMDMKRDMNLQECLKEFKRIENDVIDWGKKTVAKMKRDAK